VIWVVNAGGPDRLHRSGQTLAWSYNLPERRVRYVQLPPSRGCRRSCASVTSSPCSRTRRGCCGFYLADKDTPVRIMQEDLGHRSSRHTEHYTRVSGHKFEGLWK
jgi:hypothetical protein